MLIQYKGVTPRVQESSIITRGTCIVGDVTIGERSSVWFGAVVRADFQPVTIGNGSSVQDNAVVHVIKERGTNIGDNVTIGHGAVLHACDIHDCVLVGMNATVLDGAVIGKGSIIAAGAVVTPGTHVPPLSLVAGVPGKVIRQLDEASLSDRTGHAERYYELSLGYAQDQER